MFPADMSTTPVSKLTLHHDKTVTQADEEQAYLAQVGWKALFGFTTKQHVPIILGGIATASLAALSMPVFAIIYGLIFREYTNYGAGTSDSNKLISSVTQYCIILTGVTTVTWIANSFYFFFFLTFGELQARSARNKIFDALMSKDMTWFDMREAGIAAFLPSVQMHIRDLQLSVSSPFGEGFQALVQGVAALGVAFYYSWNLTLVIMCTIPLLYLVQLLVSNRLSVRAHEHGEKLQSALKYITTALSSIETVKCFNGEHHELQVFTKVVNMAAGLYRRVANLRSIQIGIMQFFTISVFVQGFWYGSHLIDTGASDAGKVLTTFWAALMAMAGITSLMPQLIVLQKGKTAGAKLTMLMKQISARDCQLESQGHTKPLRCPGDIEFKHVTFSYPSRVDEVSIRDASIFIPAGETTFIIGKSGSGKSTLGQLLVRFYQPSSGQIYLDGIPLENLNVQWLRQNVTLVEQHSVLFNDSIRGNLALGKLEDTVDIEDLRNAVKFAMLESVVEGLPGGLETNLGMNGNSLSGGQKQRMALARAKLRNSSVLILDESTSSLDYVTRAEILEAIRWWRKGKTTIIITHDISQIQPTDFLYLLANARVVQEGYRKELESQDGAFQAFLDSNEEPDSESDEDLNDDVYDIDETEEIISLYDEHWSVQSSVMHRPMSALLFGQSVLEPFIGGNRGPWVRNSPAELDIDLCLLMRQDEFENAHQPGRNPVTVDQDMPKVPSGISGLKQPPDVLASAPTIFPTKNYGSRLSSRASLSLSNSYPQRHSSFYSKERGSRLGSMGSGRPISHYGQQPSRITIRDALPICPRTSIKRLGKKNLLSKVRLSRRRHADKKRITPAGSLPMKEIFMSVWPAIGWSSRLLLIGAFFCAMVHSAATPLFAWVFAKLLNTFYGSGRRSEEARKYALTILGIAIIDGIASYLMFFLSDIVAQAWTLSLKTEAMRRILMQPREFFDKEENSMSRLAETMDHFAEEARNLPGRFACVFVVMITMILLSIIWSMAISWKLALVALAMGPILFAITKGYNMISSRWERLANEADDEVGEILHEAFVNIRTVRCLVLEDHFRKKYNDATTEAVNVGLKRALYSGSIFGLTFTGTIFVAILLFWYGGMLIARNEYSVDAVMQCFLVLMLSVNHVSYMAHYFTQINISREAGSRLLRLARLPTDSHEMKGTIQIQYAGDINLKKVNFTYPTRPDVQVLHDVSFNIPQGSCTAIVGSSGSGKSTIASLLLKLYQVDSNSSPFPAVVGGMSVSNHDIKTLHTTTLRSRMAIVSQTPVLFPGTVAENIAYGLSPSLPGSSMESIRAAAEAAGVDDFIDSLPQGYKTLIGEGGTSLSGGQAQRLSIARALVRDPDILILDEATSSLDVASAGVIRDTILRLVSSSSTKHRARTTPSSPPTSPLLSPWPRRVVEEGNFGDLKRKKGGAFAKLLRGERE
ncbi:ABC a-pheromone efflux pump [Pyrenophora seminiperda CCB06]|uniref:ABC a-pheromone efflux pump n=1 Tax=Pyrenophora seminiperda CCB06 TaxID=1302712 RepID=A0A3M7MCV3_9PLEO|nr:ABC a-pheromone efflux pump [Pyrenophora seminiperda CCB06]